MARKKHQKSKFRIYAEYIPFRLLYGFIHMLPIQVGTWLATHLFTLLYFADVRHRKRSVEHLMHAGITADPKEANRLGRRSYHEFAKLLVEVVKMDQLYSLDRVDFSGDPEAVEYLKAGNPTIVVTGHFGNWEVAGTAFSDLSGTPMLSLMRPFANPLIGELILNHRKSDIHELLDKNKGLRPLLRALGKKHVTVLIDQHASAGEGVVCEFFGHPARVHMTPALLHLKSGIPIVPEMTFRAGDDFRFDLRLGKLIRYTPTEDKDGDVQKVTQLAISALEEMIREAPEQWLWAPRHWLNLNRRNAEEYKDWKPAPRGN